MVVNGQFAPPLAYKSINGFKMHYSERGQGEPLVLLHGSFSDLRYWTLRMETLGSSYRVFAPSSRPFWPWGRSHARRRVRRSTICRRPCGLLERTGRWPRPSLRPFPAMLDALEKIFPSAKRTTIPNGTHIISVENPCDFNREDLAFLAQIAINK